ncbi:hypothetical protein [Kribbella caucasensis]|nr:hypothetical protein [Kribbella sp. VKM Ac-2527]
MNAVLVHQSQFVVGQLWEAQRLQVVVELGRLQRGSVPTGVALGG